MTKTAQSELRFSVNLPTNLDKCEGRCPETSGFTMHGLRVMCLTPRHSRTKPLLPKMLARRAPLGRTDIDYPPYGSSAVRCPPSFRRGAVPCRAAGGAVLEERQPRAAKFP